MMRRIRRPSLDRPVVDPERAPRIARRGQEQDRTAAGPVELGRRYLDLLAGKEGEHRQRVAELAHLEALQERGDLVHARGPACARPSRVTPSPRWSQLSAELSGIQPPALTTPSNQSTSRATPAPTRYW